ncbi:phospholipase [Sporolactobacillus sp. CPB3-1]|uniref:Phospholipase n=1 Tax=Sporolactobacillus mangiferae TaxID=2940498 RepID=A0ABT0MA00_9BACL|nr:phospholipase [Sporolactobacillus mangiferae]MCL1631687.1 phospholipase [Sporolactobacillus mangiferae]
MTYLYKISKPASVNAQTAILFTLHGVGSNYHDLSDIPGTTDKHFVQIDVQGNLPYFSGFTYYIPDFSEQSEEQVINHTLRDLDAFFDKVIQKEKLSDKQPRYFLGFSQGAILSLSYSLLYPEKSCGAVILSGRLPDYVAATAKMEGDETHAAFFIGHGQFDPLFSTQISRATRQFLEQHHFEVAYKEYSVAHGVSQDEVADIRNWLNQQFEA